MDLNNSSFIYVFISSFVTALVGGWHCAAMCGPIALLSRNQFQFFLYQFGRLLSYISIGFIVAFLGQQIQTLLPKGFKEILSVFIVVVALISIFGRRGVTTPSFVIKTLWSLKWKISHYASKIFGKEFGSGVENFSIGLVTGVLPCSMLFAYIALAINFSAFDKSRGPFVMFSLWLGSLPWLILVAVFGQRIRLLPWMRKWAEVLTIFLVITSILGFYFLPTGDSCPLHK